MTTKIKENVEQLILRAYNQLGYPASGPAAAKERAERLCDCMELIKFPLVLGNWRFQFGELLVDVPTYRLETEYSLDHKPGKPDCFYVEGPGFDRGDLLKLALACETGENLIGRNWINLYAKKLRNQLSHHSFVEELLWLNRWKDVSKLKQGPKLVSNSDKDVDFQFISNSFEINLEVKHRPKSWLANADGGFCSEDLSYVFDGIVGKFPSSQRDAVKNVLAITIYAAIDDTLVEGARDVMQSEPIDYVIFWSYEASRSRHVEVVPSAKNGRWVVDQAFRMRKEESYMMSMTKFPMRHPREKRFLTQEESMDSLARDFGVSK